jgi:hypothetical protein
MYPIARGVFNVSVTTNGATKIAVRRNRSTNARRDNLSAAESLEPRTWPPFVSSVFMITISLPE